MFETVDRRGCRDTLQIRTANYNTTVITSNNENFRKKTKCFFFHIHNTYYVTTISAGCHFKILKKCRRKIVKCYFLIRTQYLCRKPQIVDRQDECSVDVHRRTGHLVQNHAFDVGPRNVARATAAAPRPQSLVCVFLKII